MRMVDLIEKKRDGHSLSKEEIDFIISGYTDGSIPDYQMSAFAMAVYFSGMNDIESTNLAIAMLNSGDAMDLSMIDGVKVDKHSTGGVGDKVSLVLAPMVASLGVKFAKMSGRGLGHTGGTLDKLESIPGFNIYLTYFALPCFLSATCISPDGDFSMRPFSIMLMNCPCPPPSTMTWSKNLICIRLHTLIIRSVRSMS